MGHVSTWHQMRKDVIVVVVKDVVSLCHHHYLSPAPGGTAAAEIVALLSATLTCRAREEAASRCSQQASHLHVRAWENGWPPVHNSKGGALLWTTAASENAYSAATLDTLENTAVVWTLAHHDAASTSILFWGRQTEEKTRESTSRGKTAKQAPFKTEQPPCAQRCAEKYLHNKVRSCASASLKTRENKNVYIFSFLTAVTA